MITHDRWPRIKEIFYAALDHAPAERSAFLKEVCGNDAAMRDEVEALLIADADNEDFLSDPALEFAAGMLADEKSEKASEFSAGQNVGRYEILCRLGKGGMGQIYLAYDAQLRRKIALKLISREFATDPRRVQRFEQEARAASALNHPNVCVIHETGVTENGRHFIAMEYIQGETLRDKLGRGPLQPVEALRIAIQVGAALASAHAAGIVHRDIKPENIMLRADSLVKVVDFGLAKLTELLPEQRHDDEAETIILTEPHTIMGTVKYMSPEQLQEIPVDERTDIWSLGVVLYEMVTGTTPFESRSPNESIARILGSQPAELRFPDKVPVEFREIVRKALEKDCAQRYQTVTKLCADLSKLKWKVEHNEENYVTSVPELDPAPIPQGSAIFTRIKSQAISTADTLFSEIRTHKTAALFTGVTSVLTLLFFLPVAARWINGVLFRPSPVQSTNSVVHEQTMAPLTDKGTSIRAAISSDGNWMAYAEEQNGRQSLVVTNLNTSVSSTVIPAEAVQYVGFVFSRDSNYLYFTRRPQNHDDGILYRLAWPGNNPTTLKAGVDSPISISPEGDRFAFVRYDQKTTEYSLMLSNIDGTNEQVVATRTNGDTLSVFGVGWSPDGGTVFCPAGDWENGWHMNLVEFDLKNGRERAIGKSWFSIQQVAWEQERNALVISATTRQTSPHQLWRISFPDGARQKITSDLSEYSSVSISGKRILTVRSDRSWWIWVAALDDLQKASAIARGTGRNYGLSWTSKGKIVYSSMNPDGLNIYRINPDGSNQFQLTFDGDNYMPAASPDGQFIVFASNRNGPHNMWNIWRMNADDGSNPIQLTNGKDDFYPSVSPDSQWVAYDNLLKSRASVWKVPLAGGEPVKVGEKYRMPVFSPDSQFIACRYDVESGSRDVAIFPAHGGEPVRHFNVPIQEWQRIQWLPNGRELSYVKNVDGYSNIWTYDLETGTSKQLTNFNIDQIYAYAWSPDSKQIACLRGNKVNNVTMISNSDR